MKNTALYVIVFTALFLHACSPEETVDNALNAREKEDGWVLLFNGGNTDGWHLYNRGKSPSAWAVNNGVLQCLADTFDIEHGDLVTDKIYENYRLKFEWKIARAGNSGVFINVIERDSIPRAWASGPEYQLLDHENIGADYLKDSLRWAACMYGLNPQLNPAKAKAGQWNQSEIRQKNGLVEFYLNGVCTGRQDLSNQLWKGKIAQSNFKYFPLFGSVTKGRIALQDWSKGVSFKNIKIREL